MFSLSRTLLGLVVGLVILGVAGALYWFGPRATITITPTSVRHTTEKTITLRTGATQADYAESVVPAFLIEKSLEATETITRAGTSVKDGFATGTVALVNDGDDSISLLPKTRLRHEKSGVIFLTDRPIKISPHQTIAMSVTALEAGATGNVASGKFIVDKLPSEDQQRVYGKSDVTMSGGLVSDTPLTDSELKNAYDRLHTRLQQQLREELQAEAQTKFSLVTINTAGMQIRDGLLEVTLEADQANAAPGSLVASFTVSGRAHGRALVPDENALLTISLLGLRTATPTGTTFSSYDPGSVTVATVRRNFARGEAVVKSTIEGTFLRALDVNTFDAKTIAGQSSASVRELFLQHEGVEAVDVALRPTWFDRLPRRVGVITITLAPVAN